ncbi:MAG TPA: MBL fold metallo-hydrolase [Synergistales bacterium]|nr:MBL fold metallo-hydrolase [Synergistales bacterium]
MVEITTYASSSKGNLYRLTSGTSSLLLECGLPIKQIRRALDHRLHDISGVLLSHEHMDHAKAAKDILAAGIELYCSKGTADALGLFSHRIRIIEALNQFTIGPWIILPFETQHDATEPLGFLIQNGRDKILMATDTFYVQHRFIGLTHIMIECNYSKKTLRDDMHPAQRKRLLRSHMSLETLLKLLAANDLSTVREIHLLHLSDDNSDEDMLRSTVQGATGIPVYVGTRHS